MWFSYQIISKTKERWLNNSFCKNILGGLSKKSINNLWGRFKFFLNSLCIWISVNIIYRFLLLYYSVFRPYCIPVALAAGPWAGPGPAGQPGAGQVAGDRYLQSPLSAGRRLACCRVNTHIFEEKKRVKRSNITAQKRKLINNNDKKVYLNLWTNYVSTSAGLLHT